MMGSKSMRRRFLQFTLPLISMALLYFAWTGAIRLRLAGPTVLSAPSQVYHALASPDSVDPDQQDENIYRNATATALRALTGWGRAVLWGGLIGLVLGVTPGAYKLFEFPIEFVRSIPPIMILPALLVAAGYDDRAFLNTITYGCVPIMIVATVRAVQQVSQARIEMLTLFGVRFGIRVIVLLMEVIPGLLLGAQIALSTSIIISVVTEMIWTPRSHFALGTMAKNAEIAFNTPVFCAAVFLIGIFGYIANTLLRQLGNLLGGK